MFNFLLSLITVSIAQTAGFVGFSQGNNLTATAITGEVRVACDGFNGTDSAIYTCRDVVLEPKAYDYFVGPQDSRASKIEIKNTLENGTVRVKTLAYDGRKGRSGDLINLWISTVFQKPLLAAGKNTIAYKIYSSSNINDPYASGTVVVTVARGASRMCLPAKYTSIDANDCTSQYSICQRYFEEYQHCK